jgi:lysophospholipase L1-like esterase
MFSLMKRLYPGSLLVTGLLSLGLTTIPTSYAQAQNVTSPVSTTTAAPGFFFRDGDRVVMLGDSITQQARYSTLVESYVLSRFPNWRIQFRNAGWNGDRAGLTNRSGIDAGLTRDVLPHRPTAITINYGMNDARTGETGDVAYKDNLRTLAERLKAAGGRVAFISPSPEEKYEAGQPAGSVYNNMLLRYSQGMQEVARDTDSLFVDQINPMIRAIESGRGAGVLSKEAGEARLIPDGIHPNWAGHLVMATQILKGLGAPSLVSRVEVGVNGMKLGLVAAENAQVTGLPPANALRDIPIVSGFDRTRAPIRFTRTDNALPWPIHSETAPAMELPGFTPLQDLSRYELKITGLMAPEYEVRIDDQVVGKWTAQQLAAGINLSNTPGPVHDHAQKLLAQITAKNDLYYERWRQVQVVNLPRWLNTAENLAKRTAEMARLDIEIEKAEKEIDVVRRPVPHVWSIVPVAAATP